MQIGVSIRRLPEDTTLWSFDAMCLYQQQCIKRDAPAVQSRIACMQACVKEALRHRIVVPMATRQNSAPQVVHGHHIPAHTAILLGFASMNQDADAFAQPEKYLPERWLSNPHSDELHKFGGFGVGGRACPLCAPLDWHRGRAPPCEPCVHLQDSPACLGVRCICGAVSQ